MLSSGCLFERGHLAEAEGVCLRAYELSHCANLMKRTQILFP